MTFETKTFGIIEINKAGNEAYFKRDDLCAPIVYGTFNHPIFGTSFCLKGKELWQEVTKFEKVGTAA